MKICVITWPLGRQMKGVRIATLLLAKFLKILEPVASEVSVISQNLSLPEASTSDKIHINNINPSSDSNKSVIRILNYMRYQFAICSKIWQMSKNIDIIFMYGGSSLLLPNIMAHILRKRVYVFAQGPDYRVTKMSYPLWIGAILSTIVRLLSGLNWRLADRIIVESKSEIRYEGMKGLEDKVLSNGALFVDTGKFHHKKDYEERDNLIGYIGTLGTAKGVTEFVRAIPIVHRVDPDIDFLIGGDGDLLDTIKTSVASMEHGERVNVTGWIPDEDLPRYLGSLRLLVLPSYTEGLPTIVLEAMACGTPVLATSVGGVLDIIKDRQTGFILENNSPEGIANGVIRALSYPALPILLDNAHALIERLFTYDAAVERYRGILDA